MQAVQPTSSPSARADLLASYRRQKGVSDEMFDAQGVLKPVWSTFIDHISTLGPENLASRFARGDQYLRDAGILYRQYDETLSSEREWPLSHIPVILEEEEWAQISAGLIERADLLEYVLRDLYGDNQLVNSGQLPATLLSQNPAWLRPMVGVKPANDYFLNSISFEIGRGPDGKWWVISDVVEAPSTVGFAIENRMAMTRVFPNFFTHANVHRLAGFFQTFQQNLFDMKGKADGEIALMSPGPMNQNYAEHAYIARYLGLLLVEGEDLIVLNGRVMVRTVAGPKPISLLWNRVTGSMSDPLELDPTSMLGTPGLLDALRRQSLKTLNAVGAGVLETRALMAFLPKIAQAHLGHKLMMPNIATWWCGHDAERKHVLENRDRMMVGSAFSTVPLVADPATNVFTSAFNATHADALADMLRTSGRELVGQEAITLSTTPVCEGGKLVARPMCIRIFMGRTRHGWKVMPGGYARVSAGADAKAFAMQRGGRVADVWVVSPQPVQQPSLLTSERDVAQRDITSGTLPSRAADNLFWLGRYVERSELNMRLVRAYYARIVDGAAHDTPLLCYMRNGLMGDVDDDIGAMSSLYADPLHYGLHAASRINDRFSTDGMMALRALVDQTRALDSKSMTPDDIPREVSVLLRGITGFSGLVHENMYRSDGWRFLSLGLSLERAANMCNLLAILTKADAPEGALDLALEIGDSVITHRARYAIVAQANSVIDLLGPDDRNPRAIRYHITRAREHIAELPGHASGHNLTDAACQSLILETQLATTRPEDFTPSVFQQIQKDIWKLSDALNEKHLV